MNSPSSSPSLPALARRKASAASLPPPCLWFDYRRQVVADAQDRTTSSFTHRPLDARSLEWLARADSAFSLENNATLQPAKTPGDLFANFAAQPKVIDQDVVTPPFSLIQQLHGQPPSPLGTLYASFIHGS